MKSLLWKKNREEKGNQQQTNTDFLLVVSLRTFAFDFSSLSM